MPFLSLKSNLAQQEAGKEKSFLALSIKAMKGCSDLSGG